MREKLPIETNSTFNLYVKDLVPTEQAHYLTRELSLKEIEDYEVNKVIESLKFKTEGNNKGSSIYLSDIGENAENPR